MEVSISSILDIKNPLECLSLPLNAFFSSMTLLVEVGQPITQFHMLFLNTLTLSLGFLKCVADTDKVR